MTANIAFAGFTAPKILWMRKHEPENFARIAKIMLPKDYINYRLTGVHCCDYSDASGMLLLDVAHRRWSAEMLELCGVREEQMPKLFESYDVIGTVQPEIADGPGPAGEREGRGRRRRQRCGSCRHRHGGRRCLQYFARYLGDDLYLLREIRRRPEQCAARLCPCRRRLSPDGLHALGRKLQQVVLRRDPETQDYAAEQAAITPERLGRNRVFFLPYLMGERSPINDTDARGTFVGLSMDTSRADMLQAVLEGVAFAIRDSFEVAKSLGLPVSGRSKLCGGGAKSPLWRKIIANVLNISLDIPQTEEGPGYGGALLAMVGCGAYASVQACADQLVRVSRDGRARARDRRAI